ncbi:DUF1697 domain-containing protein [Demequina sp. NBRC 110056]|uniref:DUF1697 domain-containing protein n=1 Tax=Demequina sp. NBRC 110056 TaxID=1570345 RepID=UPI0009FF28C3|nr:DUF1697 domain-containing protein [Demequina sp. NBRC 110056]
MAGATHVALIRGINVGGRRPVPMARLREALEERGYAGVRTYIQSGNVLLGAPRRAPATVATAVERALAEEFDVDTVVVALTADALRTAVHDAPEGFGEAPDTFHSDVAFLRPGVSSADALAAFGIREGVDTAWAGEGAVYFQRLSAERTKSRMSKVVGTPMYADMTIRSWTTTLALVAMLDDATD